MAIIEVQSKFEAEGKANGLDPAALCSSEQFFRTGLLSHLL